MGRAYVLEYFKFQEARKIYFKSLGLFEARFLWRLQSTPVLYHLRQKDIFAYVCYDSRQASQATVMKELQARTCTGFHLLP